MIAARFRLVGWVAGCAGAALMCYMASQSVAAERSALARVDAEIVDTKSDIMRLTTEITARSRAGQLERWNGVLALQAARPVQYVQSGVQLASLANGKPLPLDTPVGSQAGVHMAAYQPAPTQPVTATVDAAPAPTHDQPMLRAATFVRPQADHLGSFSPAPAIIKASYEKPAPTRVIAPTIAAEPKPEPKAKLADAKPAKAEPKIVKAASKLSEPKLADAKPVKAMEKIAKAIDPKPKAPATKLADAKLADAKPLVKKSKPLSLLPDDMGKLVAAERKAKPAKGAL